MLAAQAPPAAKAAAVPSEPSLTERVITSASAAIDHLLRLDPRDVVINLLFTGAILLGAIGLTWLLRRVIDRALARVAIGAPGPAETEEARAHEAARFSWGLSRLAIAVGAAMLILGVWGIDARAWMSGEVGGLLVRLALVAILATALVEVAGFIIHRLVEGFARRSADPRRAAQLRTLGPILTGSAQAVLVVVGGLTILTELGLKVGPILAGAGVLGLAVGFGAQTLVKDFLTGLFLIAEDVVSVGDSVRIGDFSGVVEAMTLRTIRLRDVNATLHVFPYSEAQVIHNHTKVFSSYVAEIPVSYDNDLDRVLAVVRRVGDEIRADPAFASQITQPFEVLGVDRFADNAVHLRARFITQPRAQWAIGREFNRRLKAAFDAEGILPPVKSTPVVLAAPSPREANSPLNSPPQQI
ncbi:MAG: mechanosensitive ion channel family protein [Pseudomonadota bacterium]